jgi:hypothetical protein
MIFADSASTTGATLVDTTELEEPFGSEPLDGAQATFGDSTSFATTFGGGGGGG